MSQLTLTQINNGDTPDASILMSNLNTLKNRINLGMEADNISAGAVNGSHINLGAYIFKQSKGADVASASTVTLGNDGNFFKITGTTGITSITAKTAGTVVQLEFDGVLTITNGSNLKLGADFTTSATNSLWLVSDGTNWKRCDSPFVPTAANALAGSVVQTVNTQTGAVATGSTVIPYDDTIPQNTEGDQYMSLAITPTNATNKLKIDVVCIIEAPTSGAHVVTVALFQDSIAGALAAAVDGLGSSFVGGLVKFTHYMTAGTTSSTTFKVRAGGMDAGTFTFNGSSSGRKLGGVMASSITITEIKV